MTPPEREKRAWRAGRWLLIAAEVIVIAVVILAARAGFALGLAAGLMLSVVLGYMTWSHDRKKPGSS